MSPKVTRKPFHLTPEQLALSAERKAKKGSTSVSPPSDHTGPAGAIVDRAWIALPTSEQDATNGHQVQHIKVLTWNLLAQCLIRRDLFPISNCLKASEREHMLYREMLTADVDIMCLQEVDRLEKLLPVIEMAGYSHHYASGPSKKHGCLIAFKKKQYSVHVTKLVTYDDEEIRTDGDEQARRGRSFQTRNIGSLLALKSNQIEGQGVVVATTHLFWHPKYTYERARQSGILVREASLFRSEIGCDDWPCIIGGDFNFAPDDATYSLLVGDPVSPDQEESLNASRVVHLSVDPSLLASGGPMDEQNDEAAADPDKVITNARSATFADGLFTVPELISFFSRLPRLRSVYDEGLGLLDHAGGLSTFGSRVKLPPSRKGRNEPEYTSYTHYWKTVLDYIFILDPIKSHVTVRGLLSPHRKADLAPGIPQNGVSGSDHVSLGAEISWVNNS